MEKNPTTNRRWGIFFLIFGIVFFILMALAEAGGGNVSSTAFVIAILSIIWGWRMYKTGTSAF